MTKMVRRIEVVALGTMFVAALGCAAVLASLFFSYEPMNMRAIEPEETEVCPLAGVGTLVDYVLDPEYFEGIRYLEVRSNWVAQDVPGIEDGTKRLAADTTLPKELLTAGERDGPSRAVRPAPEVPGTWGLETTTIVRGTALGLLPKAQVVKTDTAAPLAVLPPDDPECA